MIQRYSMLRYAGATPAQLEAAAKKLNISVPDLKALANDADPTPENKFEAWVVKQMAWRNIRLPEDKPRVSQVLQNFVTLSRKKKLKHRDIAAYPKIHDLEAEIDSLKGDLQDSFTLLTPEKVKSLPGVRLFRKDSYVIAAVSDVVSLEFLGLGTKWCTRADYPEGSMAGSYLEHSLSGNVLIVFDVVNKVGVETLKPKYQFTDDFDQFMDVSDRYVPVNADVLEEIGVVDALRNFELWPSFISLAIRGRDSSLMQEIISKEFSPETKEKIKKFITNLSRDRDMHSDYGMPPAFYEIAIEWKIPGLNMSIGTDTESLSYPIQYALIAGVPHEGLDYFLFDPGVMKNFDMSYPTFEEAYRYFKRFITKDKPEYKEWVAFFANLPEEMIPDRGDPSWRIYEKMSSKKRK